MITVYILLGGQWLPYPAATMAQAQRLAGSYPSAQIWRGLLQVR
jgi:hypothetical protein